MKKQVKTPNGLTPSEVRLVRDALAAHAAQAQMVASQAAYVNDCQGEQRVNKPSSLGECAIKSPSPFEMVDDAAGRVGGFADRLNNLAARLVGEVPSGADATGIKPSRSGQIGTVADRADGIFYAVNAMHAALDRIEGQLP